MGIRNFLNRAPIAQQLRERIEKWGYMKIKNPRKKWANELKTKFSKESLSLSLSLKTCYQKWGC
jgi:phage FluMu protein Com